MCLYLNEETEKQIANEDIVCYKRVHILSNKCKSNILCYKNKPFTGIIYGIECEGKIQVENGLAYFCTNEPTLDGRCCGDKLGYNYSCSFDNDIRTLLIDGIDFINENNCNQFLTPYQYAGVKLGETYTSKLINESDVINIGLHSFTTYEDARNDAKYGIIVKCIIPKGSEYYLGEFNGNPSYASNQLKYLEIVTE